MESKDLTIITEGSAKFYIHSKDTEAVPSKSMSVFYNNKMVINRDISNLAVSAYNKLYKQDNLRIIDCMAASGISSIRMLKECDNIHKIYINDINPESIELIKKNLALNDLSEENPKIEITRKDANQLFLDIVNQTCFQNNNEEKRPNIISIDPFGTPNKYVDPAFKAIQKVDGLMCITATDTAVLFGVRPNVCKRKYMAKSLHNEYSKEIGARILIYFVSRMANINNMGIIPLLSFYSGHFVRIFAITFKNKNRINKKFDKYGYIVHCNKCGYRTSTDANILNVPKDCPECENILDFAGPLWIDEIQDKNFISQILRFPTSSHIQSISKIEKMLNYALSEIGMPISYYNIHKLCRTIKLPFVPKMDIVLEVIKDQGFRASRTHFDFTSIKTDMPLEKLKNIMLKLDK